MGFVVFVVLGAYLLISAGVITYAVRYARRNGRSAVRWGSVAVLAMYLPVFWDHIPTVIAHKYYCEKEAGFWVYKTVEQWKEENPGAVKGFMANKDAPSRFERFDEGHGISNVYLLNDRFSWVVAQQDISRWLPIIRTEQQIIDTKANEVFARYVDFGTGNSVKNTVGPPGRLKFWLRNGNCSEGEKNASLMRQFKNSNFRRGEG